MEEKKKIQESILEELEEIQNRYPDPQELPKEVGFRYRKLLDTVLLLEYGPSYFRSGLTRRN